MTISKLLYFSLDKHTRDVFHKYVKENRYNYLCSFDILEEERSYNHAIDLIFFLYEYEKEQDLTRLYVIIDYISLFKNPHSDDYSESIPRAIDLIKRAILKYPEITFLFDETGDRSFAYSGPGFLSVKNEVYEGYHRYNADEDEECPFKAIQHRHSNLFDASGLRYALKQDMYDSVLQNKKHNFSIIQESRKKNLAFCVEEETVQNTFNSYCLWANGFRVLPVTSVRELKEINENINKNTDEGKPFIPQGESGIMVRDYDLQFCDINSKEIDNPEWETYYDEKELVFPIDEIRGYKLLNNEWWNLCTDKNPYWNNLVHLPTFYITKGDEKINVSSKKTPNNPRINKAESIKGKLRLCGITKPISGIYETIARLGEIKTVSKVALLCSFKKKAYLKLRDRMDKTEERKKLKEQQKEIRQQKGEELSRDFMSLVKKLFNVCKQKIINSLEELRIKIVLDYLNLKNNIESRIIKHYKIEIDNDCRSKRQGYKIITKREDGGHCIPLDVHDLVKAMVLRAEKYYAQREYILAAVISWEAIEMLNGFHEQLLLRAYYIHAVSENAIAMNVLGGDENMLARGAEFRARIIKEEVKRLIRGLQNSKRSYYLYHNLLNDIFSECRACCRGKNHLEAEDVFVSEQAHINESIWETLYKIKYSLYND